MEVQCFHYPYTCNSSRPNKKYWCEYCLSVTSNANCLHYPYDCISSRPDKQYWCSFCLSSYKQPTHTLPRNGTYASHIQSQTPSVIYPPVYPHVIPSFPTVPLQVQVLPPHLPPHLPPPQYIPKTRSTQENNETCKPCPPVCSIPGTQN